MDKHACAACGAQAEWNPTRQALVCPHCGTEAPAELDRETGKIHETDLARALRELPDERRGWLADKRTVRCKSCQAVSVFDPGRVGQNCDFCGSAALVDYTEIKAPIRPAGLLPFKVDRARVAEAIRAWYRSRWFAPNALRSRALVDAVGGAYLPYWSFDASVHCPWTADAGHYYYTTETYRDRNGRTQTRRVRHVRWVPAAGEIDHVFDDQPVAASRGVDPALLSAIEPFPTPDLVPYDTGFLSGFVVEHYQVVLVEAAERAREAMHAALERLCASEIPGDTHRNLRIAPAFSAETFKHFLVPVWILTYRYHDKPHPVVVNGYTGKIAGRYPKSAWKICFAVLAALAAAAVVLLLSR